MRVKLALGLLVGAKLLNISVPVLFKLAVDDLNTKLAAAGGEPLLSLGSAPDAVLSTTFAILVGCKYVQNLICSFHKLLTATA